jgi:hypothetical protein
MQLGNANLGAGGGATKAKVPSSLEPRVCERWRVSRDAAGRANLGGEGDEGKEPSSLEPRVGAVVCVVRCNGRCKSWRRG